MQTVIERGCGLDVHQATVVACLLIVRKDGKVQKQMRTFGTTTADVQWRGDGRELYFLDPSDNLMAVDVEDSQNAPKLGVSRKLFQVLGVQRQIGSYVATKDGKRFLVNSGNTKQDTEPLMVVINWISELKK